MAKLPFQTAASRCASPAVLLAEPDNGTVIGSLVQRTNGIQRDLTGLVEVVKTLTSSMEASKGAINDLAVTAATMRKDLDQAIRREGDRLRVR